MTIVLNDPPAPMQAALEALAAARDALTATGVASDTPEGILRNHLATMKVMHGLTTSGEHFLSAGYAFNSVEDLLLAHGTAYQPQVLPAHVAPMRLKHCYANALWLASVHEEYTYCEGVGYSGLIPTAHAWVVDPEGRPIDPTWRWHERPGESHGHIAQGVLIGIPIPNQLLRAVYEHRKYLGILDDYENDYPALRTSPFDPDALLAFYKGLPKRSRRLRR